MTQSEKRPSADTFATGHPIDYMTKGVSEISAKYRRTHNTLEVPIQKTYGTTVSEEVAGLVRRFYDAKDASELVEAIKTTALDECEDYDALVPTDELEDDESADLSVVMRLLDTRLSDALCPRDVDASKVTSKSERDSVYLPQLINNADGGTVYMAKTLSSPKKVRIAWDLDDSNQVVVVNEYETWESLLGWKKLKTLPHGKNKIREELGDQLSDDVLDIVASDKPSNSSQSSSSSSSSNGRRTRTKPTEELLNVARGSRHSMRTKMKAKDIAEAFDNGESIGYNIEELILFPSTTDKNMTNHWWIPGKTIHSQYAAIANCNKGTFEYLNQFEQVWHIDDYLDQARSYEFKTSAGPATIETVSEQNLVFHVLNEETQQRFMRDGVIENIPGCIVEYANENRYNPPDFPHPDDIVYAPITQEDVFWLLPELQKQTNPSEEDAIICYADEAPRNVRKKVSLSSDYKLYARARLSNWSFDSTEMTLLDDAYHYFRLDKGGYEVIETLGKLHDSGEQPFSESPESRWHDAQ